MGYITSNNGRPIQGVSQQPDKTRLPGQCTASDNFRADVVKGLTTRQGTILSAGLVTANTNSAVKWYHYERGTGEEYFMSIEPNTGKVRVWSPDGQEHIVNVQDNAELSYLAVTEPKKYINMQTIGDYTFFANTTKSVRASTTLTPAIDYKAIVNVQYMTYSQTQTIWINGTAVAWWSSGPGGDTSDSPGVAVEYIADRFIQGLLGTTGSAYGGTWGGVDVSAEYEYYQVANTVVIYRKDGLDFYIDMDDDADNNNAVAIKGKLETTALLPGTAPEGFLVEIDPPGAESLENSTYFLKAVNSASDHVTWTETLAPSLSIGPDRSTMPHVLVRESITNSVATFTLRQGEWADREVGNDSTNPQPTFMSDTTDIQIKDIGIFQNRMFFTAGESVIMTRSADFFNFYRETAQAALDTDPIDIFADVPQVNFLEAHVVFDGDLVFFSSNGQFILSGQAAITPSNATLKQATSFEGQMSVDPVASGDNIFFCFEYGRYAGVREFFTDSVTDTKRARPVTDHVKEYIKGDPTIMKSSTNLNLLLIKTDADPNILYSYDWLWQGTEKVQSAWGRIIFPECDEIQSFTFVDELLWLVVARDVGTMNEVISLEYIDMGDPDDGDIPYPVKADRKVTLTMSAYGDGFRCIDATPAVPIDDSIVVRGAGAYEDDIGTLVSVYRPDIFDGYLYTDEQLSAGTDVTVISGRRFYASYTPTNPVPLDENGQALNLDRLTIGNYYMNYNTTGEVTAEVESDYGGVRSYDFNNRVVGSPENLVGFSPLVEGQHKVGIRQKSDRYTLTYKTSSHIPLEVRDFEFNGNLSRRGRRI